MADLTQRFGARLAVDRLSLSIPPGMFYGIVGPNGAGKTTALTAMCDDEQLPCGRVHGHDGPARARCRTRRTPLRSAGRWTDRCSTSPAGGRKRAKTASPR
ncbi:ATP-binding cassette domain-containing protein [Nocardiopsis sp. NPDC101807]|uniref:ATP-binding protein n=1 Tax=Nocardiopsis sp. NPDC101807 TaxID=3364339 RepID=UPI003823127E